MKASEIHQSLRLLEEGWKATRGVLNQQERALVETYVIFLRTVARTCLERGWRVWFKPNRVVHWGEGGFGHLSILVPAGRLESFPELPGEVEFITDLSDNLRLGEEITLAAIDRITYEPDQWL